MVVRNLKILFALLVGLLALFYVVHNFVNLAEAHASIFYVVGQTDHKIYPRSLSPALGRGPAWVLAAIIFLFELLAALASLWGAWKLWSVRRAAAPVFAAAKTSAMAGAGLAIFVWFGLFSVFGGGLYQMWQTEVGANSLEGAFQIAVFAFLTLIFINQPDGELAP